MTDKECLRVEIADCPWAEDLRFQVRIGDLIGSTSHSNLRTMEEVFDAIRMSMELNWEELESKKSTPAEDIFGKPLPLCYKLNENQKRRLRKIAYECLFDNVGMAFSLVVNLGLNQLQGKGGRK